MGERLMEEEELEGGVMVVGDVVELFARAIHDLVEGHDYFDKRAWEDDSEGSREEDRRMAAVLIQALETAGYRLMRQATPEEEARDDW